MKVVVFQSYNISLLSYQDDLFALSSDTLYELVENSEEGKKGWTLLPIYSSPNNSRFFLDCSTETVAGKKKTLKNRVMWYILDRLNGVWMVDIY